MSRRAAAVLPLLVLAAACQKAGRAPEPEVPEPEDLLVRLAVASPGGALERVRAYADAVSPGSGASLEPRLLRQGLAFAVQAPQLDGIDLDKPLHVLLLDPRKFARPLVIVASVSDEKALRASSNVAVEVKDGRAAVGEAGAVAAAAAFGFAAAKLAAPAAPTVTFSPAKIATRYRQEITAFRDQMKAAMGQQSASVARILEVEIDLLLRLADQTARMELVLDAREGEAFLELALFPKAGSGLAGFIAAQRPGVDTPLFARLPAVEKPSMVGAGRYDLGAARDVVLELVGEAAAALAQRALDAALRARLAEWFALFDGQMAMVAWNGADGVMQMVELFGATDGKKVARFGRELLAPVFAGAGVPTSIMGMQLTLGARAAAATHDGVEIDVYEMKLDLSSLPEMQRELTRKMYGGDSVKLFVAGFDQVLAVTMGTDGAATMTRLVDAVRKGGGAAVEVPPALAAAARRKSSVAMVLDYVQLLAPMLGAAPPASRSGLTLDFGAGDGAARLRIGVPAEHVKEITGVLGSGR